MADKILKTRILLKQAELSAWENSTLPLKKGEVVFATVAATAGNGLTEPVVMAKVCTEEGKTFGQLPWSFYAKASDVYDWAKSEKKPEYQATEIKGLEDFIAGEIQDTNTTYSFAIVDGKLVVTPSEGETTTLDFVTPDELTIALNSYYTKEEADARFAPTGIDTGVHSVSLATGTNDKTLKLTVDGQETDNIEVKNIYSKSEVDTLVQGAKDYADANDANETFAISYNKEEGKIYLTGSDGTNSEIPTADFIKDGMINTVTIGDDNDLIITFNTDAGKENIVLPLDQLVDIYTGSEGTNIKVTVTSDKKIEADLTDAVKASLGKADTAVQSVALASGTNNGTLKLTVDGVSTDNISVTGLGSAAYTNSDAYDAAGTAQGLVDALGTMAKENKNNYYTSNEVDTAITTELGKHAGIDKVGTVTSVGVGEGFKNTGTATDPVIDIIQKGEEGAVTWIFDCGGAE